MAGVYRVVSARETPYLLRAKSGSLYEPSCLVPRYLQDQGIVVVVAPLPTKQYALWTRIGDWVVTVYPFIEGEAGWRPSLTDAQWKAVGTVLKQIHEAPLPPGGIPSLRRETFDTAAYGQQIREFDAHFDRQPVHMGSGNQVERALCAHWMEHQSTIHTLLTAMETLAAVLRRRAGPFVICHADLHPGNMIRDHAGRVHLIDWDDVMLAPKERDFLFVGDAPADGNGTAADSTPPFFQGYGLAESDWVALTYYRCERVVTDLLECAQEVVFRDDLGEEAKADAIRLFDDLFAADSMIDAAWAAVAHLPSDLGFPGREMA